MYRKSRMLAGVAFLFLAGSSSAIPVNWTDNGQDHLWSTAENWDAKPTNQDGATVLGNSTPTGPTIDDSVTAVAKNVNLKSGAAGGLAGKLTMTGGTLDIGDGTPYTKDAPTNGNLWMGYFNTGETGEFEMSGGTVTCGHVMVGGTAHGIMRMTGGVINCAALEVIASNKSGGSGRAYIDGGTIYMDELTLKDDAIVDIGGGTLVLSGDVRVAITDYVAAGRLLADGAADAGLLDIDYNEGTGKTTVRLEAGSYEGQDLGVLAEHWLASGYDVTAAAPDEGLLAFCYMFEETSGATVFDSSSNGFNATVNAGNPDEVWDAAGHDGNGCIEFAGDVSLSVPAAASGEISSGITISVWLNHDVNEVPEPNNPMSFSAGNMNDVYDELGWLDGENQDEPELSEEQWYHYAFVKDCATGIMRIYHDGLLVARSEGAVAAMNGADAGVTTIGGEAGEADGFFSGKMDDLRVYEYALSQAEVLYLAGGSMLSQPLVPVLSPIDLFEDGQVNFRDFAVLANAWLNQ